MAREVVVGIGWARAFSVALFHSWFPVQESDVENPVDRGLLVWLPSVGIHVRGGYDSQSRFLNALPKLFVIRCIAAKDLDRVKPFVRDGIEIVLSGLKRLFGLLLNRWRYNPAESIRNSSNEPTQALPWKRRVRLRGRLRFSSRVTRTAKQTGKRL
jgi:hypothetical protein